MILGGNRLNIFIDESGIFSNPNNNDNCVSCLGALIIPENLIDDISNDYIGLKKSWESSDKEIKGRQLNEEQADTLINMLSDYDIILKTCAIDMGLYTEKVISEHKNNQAKLIVKNLDENVHHPNLIEEHHELKNRLASLNNQLYVQAICLNYLIKSVIQDSTLYYSLKNPKTLSNFSWKIDQKNKTITEYEEVWSKIVLPILQSMFLKKSLLQIEEGDYSYFEKYDNPVNIPHEHLKPALKNPEKDFESLDAKKILTEDKEFCDSKDEIGLQIIDNLVTILRRGFSNTLQSEGWGNIGKLMIKKHKKCDSIRFLGFSNKKTKNLPYNEVFKKVNRKSKIIL